MNENENIIDIEVIADEPTVEAPDGLPNPDSYPELPMEDKKKAVNLQDLVFVRQYVDNKLEEKLNSDVPGIVREELGDEYYNKTETDEKFYKKTDTVANAAHASNADNATNADNANHATNADSATYADSATNATEATHAVNADSATNAENAVKATNAENADYATNAGHATTAVSAETATKATNADEATHALNADNATNATNAESAVHADEATHSESADNATNADNASKATYAENAGYADNCENAVYAESAGQVANATYAETAGHANTATDATNATNAENANKINGLEITKGEDGILRIGDVVIPQLKELTINRSQDDTRKCVDTNVYCLIHDETLATYCESLNKKFKIEGYTEITYEVTSYEEGHVGEIITVNDKHYFEVYAITGAEANSQTGRIYPPPVPLMAAVYMNDGNMTSHMCTFDFVPRYTDGHIQMIITLYDTDLKLKTDANALYITKIYEVIE